jgi:hypothetical protein
LGSNEVTGNGFTGSFLLLRLPTVIAHLVDVIVRSGLGSLQTIVAMRKGLRFDEKTKASLTAQPPTSDRCGANLSILNIKFPGKTPCLLPASLKSRHLNKKKLPDNN